MRRCDNIFNGYLLQGDTGEASAISLKTGMDNECIDFTAEVTDQHYAPDPDAVKQGFLKESDIDVALRRLLTARMKLGVFDPPDAVPYSKIDETLLDEAPPIVHWRVSLPMNRWSC